MPPSLIHMAKIDIKHYIETRYSNLVSIISELETDKIKNELTIIEVYGQIKEIKNMAANFGIKLKK